VGKEDGPLWGAEFHQCTWYVCGGISHQTLLIHAYNKNKKKQIKIIIKILKHGHN
jgi:hypothetical protein